MVAVHLEAPGFGGGGFAHDGEPIGPFTVAWHVAGELAECFIQAHDIARELEAFGAEAGAEQTEGGFTLGFGHVLKAHALADVKILVHPFAPLDIVDGELYFLALVGVKRGEEGPGCFEDGRSGDAGGADGEEVRLDGACGGYAFEVWG